MDVQTIGILGAGQMGSGIAQVCALAGINVIMRDINDAAVKRGVGSVGQLESARIGDPAAEQKDAALAKIRGTTDTKDLAAADFIVEAATENLELKLTILKEIDALAKPGTIIATNTSSISITKLAAQMSRPQQFVGMHFFNPVPVMELVEVIRGCRRPTSPSKRSLTLQRGRQDAAQVKDSHGFVVNRVLVPMINEAILASARRPGFTPRTSMTA